MKSKKILFVNQEIIPYVPESPMAKMGRLLPQLIQDEGLEIRTFMPKWGKINERRNQLHEVIRLSGMNIIIDDTDHTLIIKVASIQSARLQVYFIDNDDYFHKRGMIANEKGEEYDDNPERAVFYARGVLETVKKLRWRPDIVHCHGWMSALAPLYIKTAYKDEPSFSDVKIVYSAYGETPQKQPKSNFENSLLFKDLDINYLESLGIDFSTADAWNQLIVKFSDAVTQTEQGKGEHLLSMAKEAGLPTLSYADQSEIGKKYLEFYDSL